MQSTVIHSLPGWQVTSLGNGLAYELLNKRAKQSIFFQGDDAEIFRTSLEDLTSLSNRTATVSEDGVYIYSALLTYSDALGCIWSDYAENAQDWGIRS